MTNSLFQTSAGRAVTAVTASEMAAVDRVAVEEVGLQLLQMMENAGRILAWHVRNLRTEGVPVMVMAGSGGNGGGGMVCARHLANRDIPVHVVIDRAPADLEGAAAHQHRILSEMGVSIESEPDYLSGSEESVFVDSLIGYGLHGDVRSPARSYIERMNSHGGPVVSLDVPSGTDATSGETHGISVSPDRTITLALPKAGLESIPGTLYLADISIPTTVYERLDIEYRNPFDDRDWVELET